MILHTSLSVLPPFAGIQDSILKLFFLVLVVFLSRSLLFTILSYLAPPQGLKPQSFRNPYDIPRSHLLDQLSRMRRNLLNTTVCTLRGQDSGMQSVETGLSCYCKCTDLKFVASLQSSLLVKISPDDATFGQFLFKNYNQGVRTSLRCLNSLELTLNLLITVVFNLVYSVQHIFLSQTFESRTDIFITFS